MDEIDEKEDISEYFMRKAYNQMLPYAFPFTSLLIWPHSHLNLDMHMPVYARMPVFDFRSY